MPSGDGPADRDLVQRLAELVAAAPWLLDALRAVRTLALPQAAIGAGTLRNLVWDRLHGRTPLPWPESDVDVVFFDPVDLRAERDAAAQAELAARLPALRFEVTNQAAVHLWFEACFGEPVAPLSSLAEAVASWPETATAVAVRLEPDDALTVIAPLGLEDLFAGIVRHNPVRCSAEHFHARVAAKRLAERWPLLRFVPA